MPKPDTAMLRLVLILVLCCTTPAIASPDSLETSDTIISVEELRSAIYDRRYRNVENAFIAAQSDFLARRISADDMRSLFMIFETTHPEVITFAEDWVSHFPESAYAHTAKAILLRISGGIIRGERAAKDTYSGAMRLHSQMHAKAWQHASLAYKTNARLIAASDMLITLANTTRNKPSARKTLEKVMRTDPNMGSLKRALHMAHKGWGGTLAEAEKLCATYAPMLEFPVDPLSYCRLIVWDEYYRQELDAWAATILPKVQDPYDPNLAYFRVQYIMETEAQNRAQDAGFVFGFLTRPDILAPEIAAAFDARFAAPFAFEFQNEIHLNASKRRAWHMLEHDPYNPEHLKMMLADVYHLRIEQEGDYTHVKGDLVSQLRYDIKMEMFHRLLKVAPYDPINWHSFAEAAFGSGSLASSLNRDPYEINSIVYSNHDAWKIENHLNNKMAQYLRVQKFNSGEHDEDWRKVVSDLDAEIICPLIRVYRLRQEACKPIDHEKAKFCYPNEEAAEWYAKAWSDAADREVCRWERFTPVAGLYYSPVEVDFEVLPRH